jgi:hypothetical protein
VIPAMPRPRPPHLQCEPSRHGKPRWYVRVGKGPRIRITETYGTPEFTEAYQAALSGSPSSRSQKAPKGSLAWLIAQYRDSGAWQALSVGDPAPAREHLQAGAGDRRARACDQHHPQGDPGRHRAAGQDAVPGAALPRRHARRVRMGGRGRARQGGPDRGRGGRGARRRRGSRFGPRKTLPVMRHAGRSAPRSGFGSTCCSTPACAAATP